MSHFFILLGAFLVILGVLSPYLSQVELGRLPGDFHWARGGMIFYFPVVTCLLLSLFTSLVLWFFGK